MIVKLLTHGDLDGAGCAVITKTIFPEAEILAGPAGVADHAIPKIINDLEDSDAKDFLLIITDLAISNPEIIKEAESRLGVNRLIIIDHHPESQQYEDKPYFYFSSNECATKLYHTIMCAHTKLYHTIINAHKIVDQSGSTHLLQKLATEFIPAVDAWDMWRVESDFRQRGEDLNRLFWLLGFDKFVESMVTHFTERKDSDLSLLKIPINVIYAALEEDEKGKINSGIERTVCYQVDKLKVGWCVASSHVSRIAERMILAYGLDLAVIYNIEYHSLHIRTVKGSAIHSGKIAKDLVGGGGHLAAAGGRFDYTAASKLNFNNQPVITLPAIGKIKI